MPADATSAKAYPFHSAQGSHSHAYLLPVVKTLVDRELAGRPDRRIFDLGFTSLEFHRIGRVPPLAKTMVVRAR